MKTTVPPARFVPSGEVKKLVQGSYEHRASRFDEAVQKVRTTIFGEDVPVRVIGTFPGYGVVFASDGRFAKVQYEVVSDGSCVVGRHEKMSVPVVEEADLDSFLLKEAQEIVSLFLRGSVSEAQDRMLGMSVFVGSVPALKDEKVVELVAEDVRSDRPWKELLRRRTDPIRKTVGSFEEARLHPKFEKLYDGSMRGEDLSMFDSLVKGGLKEVGDRVSAMVEAVRAAKAAGDVTAEELGTGSTAVAFRSFVEDLGQDLENVRIAVRESARKLKDVASLGKLYDSVAKELYKYELASRFVEVKTAKSCG